MTEIKSNERGMQEYLELKDNGEFILKFIPEEFFAKKINNDYAALLNYCGKYILAKRYKNCFSIGSGYVSEYDTYQQAIEAAEKKPSI